MKIDSYLFITIIYFVIFISGYFLSKIVNFQSETNRFESIDGFRGLLATGVFIHHSIVWYNYIQFEKWEIPNNYLGIHLGESSVAFFFMITSFLFTNKLLNSKKQDLQFWKKILFSRIFRLVPLYFLIITFCILFVLTIDKFILNSSFYVFFIKCLKWYSFTILGYTEISTNISIGRMLSGVTWSLPYEWLFYFSLPLIGLILRKNKNIFAITISILFILFYLKINQIRLTHLISFLGGMIPAFILYFKPNINLNKNIYSFIAVFCIIISFSYNTSNDNYFSKLYLVVTFTLIALKTDIFGILKTNYLKYIGEISYSTYLIHGILLFSTFYFIGFKNIKTLNTYTYTIIVSVISILLIFTSTITFYYIEKPFMKLYYKHFK
ncbi:acyltransferase family protein [Empedobacter sedimenti]|uniref:acyltransferase family protein n=1 Tax=Empedobacter sedimenti TaxID=3042610 RepID=UPI0024A6F3B7|nr:acyltransferase [Empedobacter sedimenti]